MHKRLLVVSLLSALSLLSACGGSDHTTPVVPPVPVVPVVPAPATPISAAALAQIDTYVQAQMSQQQIPGLSLVVTMDGKPVLEKGYGMANVAAKTPVTPTTVFRIASVSKQFAAAGIMLLVQDGRVGLDEPIATYLKTVPAEWKTITVRQLLQHTSGMRRDFPESLLTQINPDQLPPIDTLVALAAAQMPLERVPGAAFSYSNVGYHLLGFIIEKASGKYYGDFLQERIFAPLGMSSAEVIRGNKAGAAMATGYTVSNGAIVPASNILIPGLEEAEGGLQMNALDLAKWDAALLTDKILSKASLAQMWAPAKLNNGKTAPYGFGWALEEINHRPFTSHSGLLEGFTSQFDRHTGEGLSVIAFTNSDRAATAPMTQRISAIIKPELDWTVAATDPQPQLTTLMRSLLDEVRRGSLAVDERFSPEVRAALTANDVKQTIDYFKRWNTIDTFGYVDQIDVDGVQVSRYLLRGAGQQAIFGIALNGSGKIVFLAFMEA